MKVFVALLSFFALGGWAEASMNMNSSTSFSSLPISSCDASVGLLCIPSACDKNNCSLIPDAKCIPDRCGCEARFFKWNEQDKTFRDYTRMCDVFNHVGKVHRFIERKKQNDRAIATSPKVLLDLFRSFNSLVVEIMLDLARHISDVVKTDPSEMKVAKLREVLRTIQSLQRSTRVAADSDALYDTVAEKSLLGVLSRLVRNVLKDEDPSTVTNSKEIAELKRKRTDERLSEENILSILKKAVERVMDEDALSATAEDTNKDEDTLTERRSERILSKVWNLVRNVIRTRDEDASEDKQDEDIQERIPSWMKQTFTVVKKLLSNDGPYADEITSGKVAISDKQVRENLNIESRGLRDILKKIVKSALPLVLA